MPTSLLGMVCAERYSMNVQYLREKTSKRLLAFVALGRDEPRTALRKSPSLARIERLFLIWSCRLPVDTDWLDR
jgi:hypothetical protein